MAGIMVGIKDAAKSINEKYESAIVGNISKNWRAVEEADLRAHRELIRKSAERDRPGYVETEEGKKLLEELALGRLNRGRKTYVPWINAFLPLRGCRILEIGAGLGTSTVALAEQGAMVIAVDINERPISIAKDKCRIFGVSAEFVVTNAVEYMTNSNESFDAVIFFASLEHMLPDERLEALARAWHIIRRQGYLIILEAPNRLWYFDSHTARLPFFNWLPANLALQYMQFSPRVDLVKILTPPSEANLLQLQRWGLGVSFHEFDLALGKDIRNLKHHSLGKFLRRRSPLRYLGWHATGDAKFARFLKRAAPDVPGGWFESYLNLAIQHP
jgi:2-polyprenyl-3-methyl-5-hydroxy-6-metoxy-1,4-benzoquinol methylase